MMTATPPKNLSILKTKSWLIVAIVGVLLVLMALLLPMFLAKIHPPRTPFCQKVATPFVHTECVFDPQSAQQAISNQEAGTQEASNQKSINQTAPKLQLAWLYPNSNAILLNFTNLITASEQQSRQLQFAMNAGMYDERYAPIGYTVIEGKTYHGLNLKQGGGNFHLMPNGVFWWDNNGYHVTESQAMSQLLAKGVQPLFATQSGPMLVIDGKIHPSFDPNSTSYKMRNGVGVCRDGKVKFVISDSLVSFYQFADLFKTQLQCDNALFLDGGIASALYSRELNRQDSKYMGVMVTLTTGK